MEQKTEERRTARGHRHVEAFCLMWYACSTCGHCERIWNSRDGVTPFSMTCPSCGDWRMSHVHWDDDEYAPQHKPQLGQRVWESMTMSRAAAIAKRVLARHHPGAVISDGDVHELALSYFDEGRAPMLSIHGYAETGA